MEKRNILDLSYEEWESWVSEKALPRFRAAQIYNWLIKGVTDPAEMTNISAHIAELIRESFVTDAMVIGDLLVSRKDGTRKYIFLLRDGHRIETVLMKYKTGYSLCISSQSGCRMGCVFCASSYVPFGRDLTPGEMLGQILLVSRDLGERIRNIVIMGLGEAFDNFDNLLRFIKMVKDPAGLQLGARHITVSTCGLVPQMLEFMNIDRQINLAVSLHAPRNDLRAKIMPVAKAYDLESLLFACKTYAQKTGRRITFEYSLFRDINDFAEDARELASVLSGIHSHVNLIAANEFPGSPMKKSDKTRVQAFKTVLEKAGMSVTLRREMGSDIMAACGQLRRQAYGTSLELDGDRA